MKHKIEFNFMAVTAALLAAVAVFFTIVAFNVTTVNEESNLSISLFLSTFLSDGLSMILHYISIIVLIVGEIMLMLRSLTTIDGNMKKIKMPGFLIAAAFLIDMINSFLNGKNTVGASLAVITAIFVMIAVSVTRTIDGKIKAPVTVAIEALISIVILFVIIGLFKNNYFIVSATKNADDLHTSDYISVATHLSNIFSFIALLLSYAMYSFSMGRAKHTHHKKRA